MNVYEIIDKIEKRILDYYGKEFYKKTRKERHEICLDALKRFLEYN